MFVGGPIRRFLVVALLASAICTYAQEAPAPQSVRPKATAAAPAISARPKLIVLLVVDQMREDYIEKFQDHWTGGLKRLVKDGAWFRNAAYPYAATETCVGHATISTGAFPTTHGIVANAWFDRETQKSIACTTDPKGKNETYGGSAKGGDTAVRLLLPSFAEELRFQAGDATRIVTFSLKARAAIMMAGHKADGATWFDTGSGLWQTSNAYGSLPFLADYTKTHPVKADYGKTWTLALPEKDYRYDEKSLSAVPPDGWELTFPHPLRGKAASNEPDAAFYGQWLTSPFADTYLTQMAIYTADQLGLGKGGGTDFLAISYSSPDYVGHAFGPRSWEIQDILARLDKDLADLFAHLDVKVGKGNYVVALSADHGGTPIPEQMQKAGVDAGMLSLPAVHKAVEEALKPFSYPSPAVSTVSSADVYFAPDVYAKLKQDPAAMQAVLAAIRSVPGVLNVYRDDELRDRPPTKNPLHKAESLSYFPGRSGDLLIVPKPYWLLDYTPAGAQRTYGTGHGGPYYYDQRVPLLLMGWGIQPGEYPAAATPADIAPTFAALVGITLSSRDGHVLSDALAKRAGVPTAKPLSAVPKRTSP